MDWFDVAAIARPCRTALPPESEWMWDTVGASARPFVQWAQGFRMGADTVALAEYAMQTPGLRVDAPLRVGELCAGAGLISCKLGLHFTRSVGFAVELHETLAALCAENLALSDLSPRWTAVHGDLRDWVAGDIPVTPAPQLDLVVVNPPWYVPGRGAPSLQDAARHQARSEATLSLAEWLRVVVRIMAPRGRLVLIYPSSRVAELFAEMAKVGLKPIELVPKVTAPNRPAKTCFVRAMFGTAKGDLVIRPEGIKG